MGIDGFDNEVSGGFSCVIPAFAIRQFRCELLAKQAGDMVARGHQHGATAKKPAKKKMTAKRANSEG